MNRSRSILLLCDQRRNNANTIDDHINAFRTIRRTTFTSSIRSASPASRRSI